MNNYVNVIFSNYHPWYPRIPEFLVIAKGNTDVRLKKKTGIKGLETMINTVAIRTTYTQTVVSKYYFPLKETRVS